MNWVEVMMGHPFSYPNPNILEYLYGDLCVLDKDVVVLLIQAFHACLTVTVMTVWTPTHLQPLHFGFRWASIHPKSCPISQFKQAVSRDTEGERRRDVLSSFFFKNGKKIEEEMSRKNEYKRGLARFGSQKPDRTTPGLRLCRRWSLRKQIYKPPQR